MSDYIGWWSSKLYKHKKVLIAIVVTGDCGNPPQMLDCIYFTDWYINYSWDELPEEIVTEALDALPVAGGGKAVFDTGESSSPYPTISGVFRGKLKIKGEGYLKITGIKTRACSDTSAQVTSWSISPGKGNEIKRGAEEYNIEVHLSGYPQMFHDVETIENSDGKLTFVSFTDANNNTHSNWIPSLIIEGETLPELSCSAPTPSFASGCELLLSYDKDNNGKIDITDMSIAWNDYANAVITIRELDFLWDAWKKNSINAKCAGCFSPSKVSITFVTKAEDGSELREVKLYIDGSLIGEAMPSLTVELEPGKTVHVKLVKEGYRTVEFDYTVPNTAATVTKTLEAKRADFKIISISPTSITDAHPGDSIYLKATVKNVGDKADTGLIQIAWDGSIMRTFGMASISPDQTRAISPPPFIIPGSASIGTHKITVFVKPSSEDNPTDSQDIPVVLKPPTVEVTFVTKDEQGNEITGVDVYIDGVKKGTT